MRMTDEEQLNLVENHLEDIFALCGSYAESGTEEDLANIRAVYACLLYTSPSPRDRG